MFKPKSFCFTSIKCYTTNMELENKIKELSRATNKLGYPLYIVGGFVRDSILGKESSDIDITSAMPYVELTKVASNLGFKVKTINESLGTILLTHNSIKLEYTQFRKESYSRGGEHTPDTVEFVDNIEVDAMRRDLSINAIYYDIENAKYIDPCQGLSHIEKGIIRTANDPNITLRDDGLRILRVLRFASLLNFKIDKKTLHALREHKANLREISKERILKELSLLLVSDLKYGNANRVALTQINKLNLLPYIFNSTFKNTRPFSGKEITSYYRLSENARVVGFYFLVLKKHLFLSTSDEQILYTTNVLLGMDGIKESRNNSCATEKLYRIYRNLEKDGDTLTASINYLTLSNTEREIIDTFLDKKHKDILSVNISIVKNYKLPLSVNELPISPSDLIEAGIENKYISKIMSSLYNSVLSMTIKNSKEDLIEKAKEINELFSSLSDSKKETK